MDALSMREMHELAGLLRRAYRTIDDLRDRSAMARHIQYPKIPSILSESIVMSLLNGRRKIRGNGLREIRRGGKGCDIFARTRTGRGLRIEVKGTGAEAFQNLGKKDINADLLFWVNFSDFFIDRRRTQVRVHMIDKPRRFFPKPMKLTFSEGERYIRRSFSFGLGR